MTNTQLPRAPGAYVTADGGGDRFGGNTFLARARCQSATGRGPSGGADMFLALQMSGRGPDGYPLDVHPPTLPLPPQDPIWTQAASSPLRERAALLAHAEVLCGLPVRRAISPELRHALALKPRPEDFR